MEHIHIDNIKALAQSAHSDAAIRERLFDEAFGEERDAASIALWALTHLPATDNRHIDQRRTELIRLAVGTPDTSLRRLALVLLERLDWSEAEVSTEMLDFCLQHFMNPAEAVGVRALCIKLAWYQCRHYPELCAELRQCLLQLDHEELKPGLRHTRNKIIRLL